MHIEKITYLKFTLITCQPKISTLTNYKYSCNIIHIVLQIHTIMTRYDNLVMAHKTHAWPPHGIPMHMPQVDYQVACSNECQVTIMPELRYVI